MNAFKRALRRTPFYGTYKTLGHYPDYLYWHLRGRPARAPHLLKQRTVIEYGARFGLDTLVETGTYYGEMIAAVRASFSTIYSIEFDEELAERAKRKFAPHAHVHIIEGDSQMVMPAILLQLAKPTLFWLDGGYYGWEGKAGDEKRLDNELDAILGASLSHVVLLDDARGLNGLNGVPTMAQFKDRIERTFPRRRIETKHDIVRITP